jgi:hypothetical protein
MGCRIAIFYPVFACLTALYRLLAPSTVNMINRKKNCSPINFWAVVVVCMHGIQGRHGQFSARKAAIGAATLTACSRFCSRFCSLFLFYKIQARPRPWGPCQPWRPWDLKETIGKTLATVWDKLGLIDKNPPKIRSKKFVKKKWQFNMKRMQWPEMEIMFLLKLGRKNLWNRLVKLIAVLDGQISI